MEKRTTFSNLWLAAAFIAPQMLLVFVFFYWPTGEALYWAVTLEPPFGGSNEWVGWLNFETVFSDPKYWNSVRISIAFAGLATMFSLVIAAMLALFVDRRLPGHQLYKPPASGSPSVSSSHLMPVSFPPSIASGRICGIRRSTAGTHSF
jgi:sn-glycerol 3-phosphate transport system permease protein